MTYAPLAGLRVLDISRLYPGALATQKLADLGADVVKFEEPGRGDYIRTIPPVVGDKGILHLLLDRGKRSVAADLKSSEGLALFGRLASVADVIVESARPGRYLEMGIDFAQMRRARPALVVCSVSGFGQTGPLAPLASHGMNMDALAGVLISSEFQGRKRFVTLGFSIGVEMGAVNAALGVAAAVFGARATGQGAWIDASCWDGAVEIQRMSVGGHLGAGAPLGPRDPRPLYDLYECSDGRLVLFCAIERKFWESFCRGVGREDLIGAWNGVDVDFGSAELRGHLEKIFITETAAEWEKRFGAWDIPGSSVLELADVLSHPHLAARDIVRRRPGEAPFIANPLRSNDDGTRPGDDATPPPELGAHTEEVIREWLEEGSQ
jgi:crotonobetainyl-CoA:carnitine CoA-transferase CaiB-like acyl-CoA transferase